MYEIINVEKIFTGKTEDKDNKPKTETNPLSDKELVEQARAKGLKVPRKY